MHSPLFVPIIGETASQFEHAKAKIGLGFASFSVGTLLLIQTILGTTVIAVPEAMASAGYLWGSILFAMFAGLSAFGCHLLHRTAIRLADAPCSWYSVSRRLAPELMYLSDLIIVLNGIGGLSAYLMIIGDDLSAVIDLQSYGGALVQRRLSISLVFVVVGPLACMRRLTYLQNFSVIATLVVLWTTLQTCLFASRIGSVFEPCGNPSEALPCDNAYFGTNARGTMDLGKHMGFFVIAYVCQNSIFILCNEVENTSPKRFDGIVIAAHGAAFLLVLVVGFAGYATYGVRIHPNMLLSYPRNPVTKTTRLLFLIVAAVTYAMQAHPCRESLLTLWESLTRSLGLGDASSSSSIPFWGATTLIFTLTLTIAFQVQDLGIVWNLLGATGSTSVSYIMPSYFYLRAYPEPHFKRTIVKIFFVLGFVLMVACVVAILFL